MDLHQILGVRRGASKDEIKHAFRKLAKQFHPDKNAHCAQSVRDAATLKFKQISDAYDILSDDSKSAAYNNPRPRSTYSSGSSSFSSASANYYANSSRFEGGRGDYNLRGARYSFSYTPQSLAYQDYQHANHSLKLLFINFMFVCAMFLGSYSFNSKRELWQLQNPGKCIELTMKLPEK